MSNSLDPDHTRRLVGPDLDLNCLQWLSADDTSRKIITNHISSTCIRLSSVSYCCYLLFILPIIFVQKMSSAITSALNKKHFRLIVLLIMESNTVNPYQSAPNEAV